MPVIVRVTKAPNGVEYVYTVESYRDGRGKVMQRIVSKHGRLDELVAGDPDAETVPPAPDQLPRRPSKPHEKQPFG